MIPELNRLLEPIRNRIRLLVARALITSTRDGEGGITLELDLGSGEVRDELETVQQYGISSRPRPGSQVVTLFVSGSRDAGVVIASKGMGSSMSFALKEGEVALHTDEGDSVHLKRGRVIAITTKTLQISGDIELGGKLEATGNISSSGDVSDAVGTISTLRTAHDTHTHVGAPWVGVPSVLGP